MNASAHDRKPKRSVADIERFQEFVKGQLRGEYTDLPLPRDLGPTRKIYGHLVDHNGLPMPGAMVFFVKLGNASRVYEDMFDETDENGRFVVEADDHSSRLAVCSAGPNSKVQSYPVPEGHDYVEARWPELASCRIRLDESICDSDSMVHVRGEGKPKTGPDVEFTGLLPGEHCVSVESWKNENAAFRSYSSLVGTFDLQPGEHKELWFPQSCPRRSLKLVFYCLPVSCTLYTASTNQSRSGGGAVVDTHLEEYGSWISDPTTDEIEHAELVSRPLPPGNYHFLIEYDGASEQKHEGGDTTYVSTHAVLSAADVAAADTPLLIDLRQKEKLPPGQQVHRCLDSRHVSCSASVDENVALLMKVCDQDPACLEEVKRIAGDLGACWQWQMVVFETLVRYAGRDEVCLRALIAGLNTSCMLRLRFALDSVVKLDIDLLRRSCPALVQRFNEPERWLRWIVLRAIEQAARKHDAVLQELSGCLLEALKDPYSSCRRVAARTLGDLQVPEAVEMLKKMAKTDSSGQVRALSGWAAWKINGDREFALQVLRTQLFAEDIWGKESAARRLREFDDLPADLIEALERLESFTPPPPHEFECNEAVNVRHSAEYTLKAIRERKAGLHGDS